MNLAPSLGRVIPTSSHHRPHVRVLGRSTGRVVRHLYRHGCNVAEIAAHLAIRPASVKTTLRRLHGGARA